MMLRNLTEAQISDFQRECERRIEETQKSRSDANPLNTVDAKVFFSHGMRAVLARITELPQ